jgi:acetyl-CoA synthetase
MYLPTFALRYWDLIQRHKVSQFYTAPTAIRTLIRHDKTGIRNYDLSSLRILGSVGEPINREAWLWYYHEIGQEKCSIVDTYWQTETGGHLATSLPGIMNMKPGSCALPYFGISFAILDPMTGHELEGGNVSGVLCIKQNFPSIARTVYGDHDRYLSVYMRPYKNYYFTGDGCKRDNDGFYWITGRVDDVINPSGHRIGTAEIETALAISPHVSESAVVGFPHEIKGEGIGCFVILKHGIVESHELVTELKSNIRKAIGPFATPDFIIFGELPKTRSGKIMRRILRKIAHGEEDSIGDVSTLADPNVVTVLIEQFKLATGK